MVDQRKRVVQKSEVAVQFTGKNLTSVGGIGLFHKFARQLGVEKALASRVELPRRVGKYTSARLLLSLVYAFVLDLTRLSDTLLLRQDKVSHKLIGFGDFPHPRGVKSYLTPRAPSAGFSPGSPFLKRRKLERRPWTCCCGQGRTSSGMSKSPWILTPM